MVSPDTNANMNAVTDTIDNSKQKLLFEGSFFSGVHTASRKALKYEDITGKKSLVFENFKTLKQILALTLGYILPMIRQLLILSK